MRREERGQASVEALAVLPVAAALALVIWQLGALLTGAMELERELRAAALARAPGSRAELIERRVEMRSPVPGVGTLALTRSVELAPASPGRAYPGAGVTRSTASPAAR